MKKFVIQLVLFIFALYPFQHLSANTNAESISIIITKEYQQPDDENRDNPTKGHRVPPRPVYCYISAASGISVSDPECAEIISFEIKDEDGNTLFITSSEEDFISCIFTLDGCIQILLYTHQHVYSGYIDL